MPNMPKIDLDQLKTHLSAEDYALVAGIVNTHTGCLRASKPTLPRKKFYKADPAVARFPGDGDYDYADDAGRQAGMTAYVWRFVAFMISPIAQHQCMPCMAFCDLPGRDPDARRLLEKRLDALADAVVDTVKMSDWHGVTRWAQVYGLTGTPQYTAEGAVIYR